ncbi:MAG TPA: hypothetical protein VF516_42435, partial [Kofleriaceae bacterium]
QVAAAQDRLTRRSAGKRCSPAAARRSGCENARGGAIAGWHIPCCSLLRERRPTRPTIAALLDAIEERRGRACCSS